MAVISRGRTAVRTRGRQTTPVRGSARGRILAHALAFALGALLAGGSVFVATRPDPTEALVERLRAEAALRDKEQIKALTELARTTRDRLAPVLEGLERALPHASDGSGTAPAEVTSADVESWRRAVTAAVEDFADPPSGETATNVARASLASAVRQLAVAVDTYAAARRRTGSARDALIDLAARQRGNAIFTWSVGATALDAVNVDAGHGHQHVFLSTSEDGALTPDPEPEGAHSH